MTQPKNFKIAIIGAGAAGYFAAAALKRNCANVDVTVIYDPDTPYIGVGESLGWYGPTFFSKYLGLHNDFVWLKKSGSTYKYSVALQDWHDESGEKYFMTYPFNPSYKALNKSVWTAANTEDLLRHNNEYNMYSVLMHLRSKGLVDDYCVQQYANELWWHCHYNTCHISPKQIWNTQRLIGHSYHINADHIRHVIHDMVGRPAGVEEIAQRVKNVVIKENGFIDHVVLGNDQQFHADLFIDSTGFAKVLARHLPYEFEHCDEYFNNSALVGQHKFTGYDEYNTETLTCGMKYGWRFSIPVHGRSGEGYQFNSRIYDNEQVLMDEFYSKTGKTDVEFRRLRWQPGYYKNAMVNNCITIGISHGFSDVFDANNFSSTIRHIGKLVDYIQADPARSLDWRDSYNTMVDTGNQYIKLRIQTAFHLARRNDTVYWQAMKEADRKFKTQERLIDTALDPHMRSYPDSSSTSNRMYTNHIFINQALYNKNHFDPARCQLDLTEFEEQQALIFFNYFRDTYSLRAKHSQSVPDFYRSMYPNLDASGIVKTPDFYLDFLG
jgi:tryptophan halogenase